MANAEHLCKGTLIRISYRRATFMVCACNLVAVLCMMYMILSPLCLRTTSLPQLVMAVDPSNHIGANSEQTSTKEDVERMEASYMLRRALMPIHLIEEETHFGFPVMIPCESQLLVQNHLLRLTHLLEEGKFQQVSKLRITGKTETHREYTQGIAYETLVKELQAETEADIKRTKIISAARQKQSIEVSQRLAQVKRSNTQSNQQGLQKWRKKKLQSAKRHEVQPQSRVSRWKMLSGANK